MGCNFSSSRLFHNSISRTQLNILWVFIRVCYVFYFSYLLLSIFQSFATCENRFSTYIEREYILHRIELNKLFQTISNTRKVHLIINPICLDPVVKLSSLLKNSQKEILNLDFGLSVTCKNYHSKSIIACFSCFIYNRKV